MSQEQEPSLSDDVERIDRNVDAIGLRVKELGERVDQLEYVVERLVADLPTQKRSKREKMAAVVRHAVKHGNRGPGGVSVTKAGAAGAADCSKRHALNLFDDLGEQFPWAEKETHDGQARLTVDMGGEDAETFIGRITDAFPEVAEE